MQPTKEWEEFQIALDSVELQRNVHNRFEWSLSEEGSYSTSSYYHNIMKECSVPVDNVLKEAVNFLWSIKVPSNAALFRWRFLTNRLPTKELLH